MLHLHALLLGEPPAECLRTLRKKEKGPFSIAGDSKDCVEQIFETMQYIHDSAGNIEDGSITTNEYKPYDDQRTLARVSDVVSHLAFENGSLNLSLIENITIMTMRHLGTAPFPSQLESGSLFSLPQLCIRQSSTIMARCVCPAIVKALQRGLNNWESKKNSPASSPNDIECTVDELLPYSLRLKYTHLLQEQTLDSPIHENFLVSAEILPLYTLLMSSIEQQLKHENSTAQNEDGQLWCLEMFRLLLVLLCATSMTVFKASGSM